MLDAQDVPYPLLAVATATACRTVTGLGSREQAYRRWVQRCATRHEVGVGLLHYAVDGGQFCLLGGSELPGLTSAYGVRDGLTDGVVALQAFAALGSKQAGELVELTLACGNLHVGEFLGGQSCLLSLIALCVSVRGSEYPRTYCSSGTYSSEDKSGNGDTSRVLLLLEIADLVLLVRTQSVFLQGLQCH